MSAAQGAVDEFHHQLDTAQDELVWRQAAREFQHSMTIDDTHALFARIRSGLGPSQSSRAVQLHVNHMPAGTFMTARFKTKFGKGEAEEDFSWVVRDGKPRLLGYFVKSASLRTE